MAVLLGKIESNFESNFELNFESNIWFVESEISLEVSGCGRGNQTESNWEAFPMVLTTIDYVVINWRASYCGAETNVKSIFKKISLA